MIRSIPTRRVFGAAVAVALVAAACGGGDDDDADGAPDSATATTAGGPAGEPADEPAEEPADESTETTAASEPADEPDEPSNEPAPEPADQVTSEGEGGEEAMEPEPGGVLQMGLGADGTGFNTLAAISPGSIRVITSLNDALMTVDIDGNPTPLLAESVEPNEDFTTWTIKLRPDVTFHDGVPVDAAAVKANLDAFRSSPSVGYGMSPVAEIVVVDDLTVEVRLSEPWVAFDSYMAGQPGWMVSPATLGTNDTFVGTGPFVLESWTPGDSARVVRNENYWREGQPYLDGIDFKFIPDPAVRRQALESGDIDLYISPTDADILDYLDDDAVDVWIGEAASNESLFLLNTTAPPFDDVRVRQAMAYGLDRQLMVDVLRSGLTIPADGPINPGSQWFAEVDYPDYDPALAAELVAEYEADVGPVAFVLKGEPTPESQEQRELAASFWQDAGMDVTLEDIGLGQSVATVIGDDFQAIAWVQFSAYDPDGERSFFRSGGPLNWSNLEDPVIDEALDTGRANGDFDTRYAAYTTFQEQLAAQLPMIWVDHLAGVEAVASSPSIHGINARVLPDGSEGVPLLAGSFFSFEDVWMEQ